MPLLQKSEIPVYYTLKAPSLEDRTCDLVVRRPGFYQPSLLQLTDTDKEGGLQTEEKTSFTQAFLLKHSYPSHRFSQSGPTKYRHHWGLLSALVLRSTSFNPEVSGLSPQVSFSKTPVVTMNWSISYIRIALLSMGFMKGSIHWRQSWRVPSNNHVTIM